MGESVFGVLVGAWSLNRKSCDSGIMTSWLASSGCTADLSPQMLLCGRSLSFLNMPSAVSLTIVSVDSTDEVGESALSGTWFSCESKFEANVDGRDGASMIAGRYDSGGPGCFEDESAGRGSGK